MADDPFDFLEDAPEPPAAAEPTPEPAAPQPVSTPAQEPAQSSEPTPEPPKEGQSGSIPMATFLDVRDREKEARRRAEAAEAELKQLRAPKADPIPSFYEDPEGFQTGLEQRLAEVELRTKMDMSGRFASQVHGADAVEAAKTWGLERTQSEPLFGQQFMAQADPFGWLVRQHRREQALGTIGEKPPEEWARDWAVSQGWIAPSPSPAAAQAQAPPQPAPQVQSPPRSIAGQPSAGGLNSQPVLSERELLNF